MNGKVKLAVIITAVIFILSAAWTVIILRPPRENTVEIVQDGTVLYVIDLDSEADRSFDIAGADGGVNTVKIENGSICVSYADCPDKTCVKMGRLRSESLPIVCLPHKLVIRFAEEQE